MSATLHLSNEAAWMPSSHKFDTILKLIADALDPVNSSLANTIRTPIGGFPYLDISKLDDAEFADIMSATTQVERRLAERQNDTLMNKGLFSVFSELVILLSLDKRCSKQRYTGVREIVVDDGVVWSQPAWIYVFVLNYLSHFALPDSRELALFFQRTQEKLSCDLRDLVQEQTEHLTEAMEKLNLTLGEGRTAGGSSAFKEELYPAARQLYALFNSRFDATGN